MHAATSFDHQLMKHSGLTNILMSYCLFVLHCVIDSSIAVDDMARPHLRRFVVLHVQVRPGTKRHSAPLLHRLVSEENTYSLRSTVRLDDLKLKESL